MLSKIPPRFARPPLQKGVKISLTVVFCALKIEESKRKFMASFSNGHLLEEPKKKLLIAFTFPLFKRGIKGDFHHILTSVIAK
jgi:hypothetical protein